MLEAWSMSTRRHVRRRPATPSVGQPDVVVLDIRARRLGMQVLEALRADDQRIATIVLTNDPAPGLPRPFEPAPTSFRSHRSSSKRSTSSPVRLRRARRRARMLDRFQRLSIRADRRCHTLEFKA
jgi:CheY-like chemotaxis protein